MRAAARPIVNYGLRHWPVSSPEDTRVVSASGELDLHAASALRELIVHLRELGAKNIAIDLGAATFIDSTAIGVLAGQLKQVSAAGGTLVIACTNDNVLRTVEIAGMNRAFVIEPTVPRALARVA
jgi:anti-sigma B factor antagonist